MENNYAELTITVQIRDKKFEEMKESGFTDVGIQKVLEGEIQYKLSRSGIALIEDVTEVKLIKYR